MYAGDCTSGICIGQVCRVSEKSEGGNAIGAVVIGAVAMFMAIGVCISICLMRKLNKGERQIEIQISKPVDEEVSALQLNQESIDRCGGACNRP